MCVCVCVCMCMYVCVCVCVSYTAVHSLLCVVYFTVVVTVQGIVFTQLSVADVAQVHISFLNCG